MTKLESIQQSHAIKKSVDTKISIKKKLKRKLKERVKKYGEDVSKWVYGDKLYEEIF